jgi:hypothetical protein
MHLKYFVRAIFSLSFVVVTAPFCSAQRTGTAALNVRMITDEADAVLAILAKRNANQPISDADWQRVFSSEGYIRLKQRETAMKRSFEDTEFKAFVLSDPLAQRAEALRTTLERWKRADVIRTAGRAFAYLPKHAQIRAKIYPVIKPRENSFVFGSPDDPAIFLYLDPAKTKAKFENDFAHELHHIGYSSSCPSKRTSEEIAKLPTQARIVLKLIGAFGEGVAMLAAAGGPNIHPHAESDSKERDRWDRDILNFNQDLKTVETFFLDILKKRLTEAEIQEKAFSFFGIQGPWYTVGYKMSVLIEKTYGRKRLIECICDQRQLLSTYNQAATKHNRSSRDQLPLWSAQLIEAISQSPK